MNVLDRERGSKDLKAWRNQISNINKCCWQSNCGPNIRLCLMSHVSSHGLHNIDSSSSPHVIVIMSALVTIIQDKDPGAPGVVWIMVTGVMWCQVMLSRTWQMMHKPVRDCPVGTTLRWNLCFFVCVRMIIQHFLNVVPKWPLMAEVRLVSSLPMMIRKGLKPNITIHLYNRHFKWVSSHEFLSECRQGRGWELFQKLCSILKQYGLDTLQTFY